MAKGKVSVSQKKIQCRHLDPNDELYGVTPEMAGYEKADCPKDCPYYKRCWSYP